MVIAGGRWEESQSRYVIVGHSHIVIAVLVFKYISSFIMNQVSSK